MINRIGLDDALALIHRRPGLVLGPAASLHRTALEEIARDLVTQVPGIGLSNDLRSYLDGVDIVKAKAPSELDRVVLWIRQELRTQQASLDLAHLVKTRWSACVSLTPDMLFESALRDRFDGLATSRTVTVIDHPSILPPPRTLPIYKLLGSLASDEIGRRLVTSKSELLLRQAAWPTMLATLTDHLRQAPLFLIGTESELDLTAKFLSTIYSRPPPHPGILLFLASDPAISDPTIASLALQHSRVYQIECNVREFCRGLEDQREAQRELQLQRSGWSQESLGDSFLRLADFNDVVSIVPSQIHEGFDPDQHRKSLVDALFSPTSLDWVPYLADLPLERSQFPDLLQAIIEQCGRATHSYTPTIVVRGEAGVGKTTLLKHVAVNLARDGKIVLWLNRATSDNWLGRFQNFLRQLGNIINENPDDQNQIVVVCDDPWALRVSTPDLLSQLDRHTFRGALVLGVRNTDALHQDSSDARLPKVPDYELEVAYKLHPTEMASLQDFLVRIGAATDAQNARLIVESVRSDNATDILCSLWYLLPETRSQITASLQDEYQRLGMAQQSIEAVAHEASEIGGVAKLAYECVTVTSHLNIPLPMEVLVHALGIGFQEWLDMCVSGRPLWGLVYDEDDPDSESVVYRTRNEIVTRVLLNLLNAGSGHAGEFRVLRKLVSACSSGLPQYRAFLVDLLVRRRVTLEEMLSFEQGEELFTLAESTFPLPDRNLAHHHGLWLKNKGNDYSRAYEQLQRALNTPEYPGSRRSDPLEFVHTSMAATIVAGVKDGTHERESGLEIVKDHLRFASGSGFFNPHTAHVFANLLFELGVENIGAAPDKTCLEGLSEALHEIERTLQLIGSGEKSKARHQKSIEMLHELQNRICNSVGSIERLEEIAVQIFNTSKGQAGFEALARRLLADACNSDKGTAYNGVKDYIASCLSLIKKAGEIPSAGLLATRLDLMVRWRLQHPKGPVDWALLRDDLDHVLRSPRYRDDVTKKFLLAVVFFHLEEYSAAEAQFSALRRTTTSAVMPHDVRAFYVNKEGMPRRFQGTARKAHGQIYVYLPELRNDIPARGNPNVVAGETVHVYVGFAIYGPTAVFRRPTSTELLLP